MPTRSIPVIVQSHLADELETTFGGFPLSYVLPRGRDLLDAVVGAVHYEEIAFTIHCQARWVIELAMDKRRAIKSLIRIEKKGTGR